MSRLPRNRYLYPALFAMVSLQGILPLRDQWSAACEALSAGEPQRALVLFREFDHWYAQEPAVLEPGFAESRVRLWALAAMESGSLQEAIGLLERWLADNPEQERFRAFLRFQLAELYRAVGNAGATESHRQQFLEDHPDLPECILIHWSRADEALTRKDFGAASAHMQSVIDHPGLPPSGRSLAGAAMASIALMQGKETIALKHLVGPDPHATGPVLDFWRAMMAPSLVQQLLAGDMPDAARIAADWFDSPGNLQERLHAFRQSLPSDRPGTGIRQALWDGRWSAQLHQLEAALQNLTASMNEPDALYALRLRTLLRAGISRDAAILGRALVESPGQINPELRARAYSGAIEACLQLKAWDRAQAYARDFLDAYPDDPGLPDIIFMNARTAAARKDWTAALDQVSLLVSRYPEHASILSWKILQSTWLLAAGQPAKALRTLKVCQADAPHAWQPFLTFQTGRCQEALKELDTAARLYQSVADLPESASNLRESAHTALLKLHFRRRHSSAFLKELTAYRTNWPDGLNRLIVENLAGSFYRRSGKIPEAVEIFSAVASEQHPAAGFARSQLSSLYRESNNMANLRHHALRWISGALAQHSHLPPDPFHDLKFIHQATGQSPLPEATLQDLLDAIEAGNPRFPAGAFLDLLRQDWLACRDDVGSVAPSIESWVEARVRTTQSKANWPAFAVFQLYAARLYEEAGRTDSADARRIQVIQSVDASLLGESALFTVAQTAHTYDFPEKQDLLESFLRRFPASGKRPEALYLLSGILRTQAETVKAKGLLTGILSDWPDSAIHKHACFRLAQWHLEDASPDAALDVLATLLEAPRLPPGMTANALLLRARADFQTDNPQRAVLNAFRILDLYPDFQDTCVPAFALMLEHLQTLDNPRERAAFARRLRESATDDVLSRFTFPEA